MQDPDRKPINLIKEPDNYDTQAEPQMQPVRTKEPEYDPNVTVFCDTENVVVYKGKPISKNEYFKGFDPGPSDIQKMPPKSDPYWNQNRIYNDPKDVEAYQNKTDAALHIYLVIFASVFILMSGAADDADFVISAQYFKILVPLLGISLFSHIPEKLYKKKNERKNDIHNTNNSDTPTKSKNIFRSVRKVLRIIITVITIITLFRLMIFPFLRIIFYF